MAPRIRSSVLVVSGLLALGAAPAFAGPNGPSVVGGSATISGAGTATVTVTQSSPSAIINWNTFNIGAGEVTTFNQPSAASVVLNRVTGGQGPSQIYGTLAANGRVFLINRDGILFGPTATVDTAGFLATTHDIANNDFMAGRYVFGIPGRPDASIVNQGTITAHSYGFAALVAPGVRNTGTITANLGTVALVSGNGFTLDFYGDKLITLAVGDQIASQVFDVATGQPLSSLVSNAGKLKANGGQVELTAATARRVVDSVINNTGVIEANTFRKHGGTIVLSAGTGATKVAGAPKQTIKLSGTLSASAKKKGKGGTVIVTAENIEVAGAHIDVSGKAGGGTVLIGGDWSGGNPNTSLVNNPSAYLEPYAVPTAATVTVDGASVINASAAGSGNGGKVIVWSDGTTTFAGTILARGGLTGGDGGFVETSGHQLLNFTGSVDTRAPNGAMGTLLLDPYDVTISSGSTSNGALAGGSFTPSSNSSVLNATTLQNALATANVLVTTGSAGSPGTQTGNITVDANVAWSSASTLTLSAYNNISFNAGAVISNTGAGNLILRADNSGTGTGYVSLGSGNVDFSHSTGTVSVYYDPIAGYTFPTYPYNYAALITSNPAVPNQVTAYMLVNSVANLQSIATNSTTLGYTYALGKNIDATTFGGYTAGTKFTGIFDGNGGLGVNSTISNLTLSSSVSPLGLFPLIGTSGIVRNLNLANVSITAGANTMFIGSLAGENDGTISNVSVTGGTVSGGSFSGIGAGGLVGENKGTITQSSASVAVTVGSGGTNFNEAGGLAGTNFGTISNSSAGGAVSAGNVSFAGGLVGENGNGTTNALISNSSASGNVTGNYTVGGLAGVNFISIIGSTTATITGSHATGNVTLNAGGYAAGGLVGQNEGRIDTSYYEIGTVTGSGTASSFANIGGLVGLNSTFVVGSPGLIVDSRAGNASNPVIVTGAFGNFGGLVGSNTGAISGTTLGLTFANATVNASGASSTAGGLIGSNTTTGGTIANVYAMGAVSLTISGTSTSASGYAGGLIGENFASAITNSYATGAVTLTVSGSNTFYSDYAGGLIGFNTSTNGAVTNSYATGAVTVTLTNTASSTVLGSSVYAGGLIGDNFGSAVTNSYATGAVALTVSNSNSYSSSNGAAGGLIGINGNGSTGYAAGAITNSYATGAVSLTNSSSSPNIYWYGYAGGLIGYNGYGGGSITNSYATGAVVVSLTDTAPSSTNYYGASGYAGGLIGENYGSAINNSYATGAVTLAISNSNTYSNGAAGGLIGYNYNYSSTSTITNSHATGVVAVSLTNSGSSSTYYYGSSGYAGGLIGQDSGSTITNSYATGAVALTVSNSNANANSYSYSYGAAGGLIGYNDYTGGAITNAYATGAVVVSLTNSASNFTYYYGSSAYAGGLIGENLGASIASSFATGAVSLTNTSYGSSAYAGGLIGYNGPSGGTVANSYATGAVTLTNSGANTSYYDTSNYAGGLIGYNSSAGGTISNSYATGAVTLTNSNSNAGSDYDYGSTNYAGGLIGYNSSAGGTITNSHATGTVTLTNSDANPASDYYYYGSYNYAGGLIGYDSSTSGTITNAHATGAVTLSISSSNTYSYVAAGGLIGENSGPTVTKAHATGVVTVTVTNSDSNASYGSTVYAGGLIGSNDYNSGPIANVHATGAVGVTYSGSDTASNYSSSGYAGGLIGINDGSSVANAYATGAVTLTISNSYSYGAAGGLIGLTGYGYTGGTITNSYATGAVILAVSGSSSTSYYSSSGYAGGLIGENESYGSVIANSYATGPVTLTNSSSSPSTYWSGAAGGLIGYNGYTGGTITNSYATGAVVVSLINSAPSSSFYYYGASGFAGGLIGQDSGSTITNSYATGAVTLTNSNSSTNTNTYSYGDAGGLIGYVGSAGGTITNSYATGAVLVSLTNPGSNSTNIYYGSSGYAGGLIGENYGSSITNSYATGAVTIAISSNSGNVYGSTASAGGLIGANSGPSITDSYATGAVSVTMTGTGQMYGSAGGLIGSNSGMSITNSHATGSVNLTISNTPGAYTSGVAGGLIGIEYGLYAPVFIAVTNSYATGAVTIAVSNSNAPDGSYGTAGGLVGQSFGTTITNSYATGNITGGLGALLGGFIGINGALIGTPGNSFTVSTISESHATGNVTGGDGSAVGGFVGVNLFGAIDHSYAVGAASGGASSVVGGFGGLNLGAINIAFSTGPATGGDGSFVGGFVGVNYSVVDPNITTPTGVITQSYATSTATGGQNSYVAGFAAINVGSLDQTLAAGLVTGGAGSTTGGLVASNTLTYSLPTALISYLDPPGTATNSYWDTQTTGQTSSAGGTGQTTPQLTSALPAGFDPVVWAINAGQTYPYLIDPAPNPLPTANPQATPSPPTPVEPTPTPSPLPLPLAEVTLPAGTPVYAAQQIADYSRTVSATPATIPAPLVTPPSPLRASPPPQRTPNNVPQVDTPRVSGVPPLNETRFIQDQVVIRICDVPAARVQMIARRIGLSLLGSQSLGLVGCAVYQCRITDGQSVRDKIRKLEALRVVAAAQPNYVFALAQVPPAPADTPPPSEGDPAQYAVAKLRLPEVHRLARGNNVRIAVIDSEIDVKHPDLEGAIAERFDATGAEEKPHPHGTGMAGAIASHKRLIGVAPGAQLLAVHAFGAATTGGQGTTMQIVKGLDWAVGQNVRIVNMSFAGPADPLLQRAVKALHDKGIVLIAAAGNAGPDSPPLYPGADPNVIAVTAVDEDDHSYTGANRGKYVAVAAPGVDVLVPAPDGSYQLTTGTSVAAAEVSGVAALLLEKDPKLTPDEIRSILTSTARMLGTKTRDDEFGYGLVDPYKALTSVNPKATSLEPAPAPVPITAAAR